MNIKKTKRELERESFTKRLDKIMEKQKLIYLQKATDIYKKNRSAGGIKK